MYLNRSRKVPELWAAVEAGLPDGCRSTSAVASLSCTFGSHLRTAAPSLLTPPRRLPLASSCVSSAVSNHALQERAHILTRVRCSIYPSVDPADEFQRSRRGCLLHPVRRPGRMGCCTYRFESQFTPCGFFVTERFLTSPFSPSLPPPSCTQIPIQLAEISPPAFRATFPGVAYQLGNVSGGSTIVLQRQRQDAD